MNDEQGWLEASVQLPRQLAPQAEALMASQGAMAVTLTDVGDTPVLEPAVGETPLWEMVRITGLFPGGAPNPKLAAVLSLAPGVESPDRVVYRHLDKQPWERAWLQHFEPMRFGRDLWIVPGGYAPPESAGLVMRLDPGLAFGTGAHATTRLCLEWIDAESFAGLTVIDFGCGSGVLGIAAALKGARRVICVDNDAQALTAARMNAERNGVQGVVETVPADDFSALSADVLLANILAGTLVELAPRLGSFLRHGGKMVLSGILTGQAAGVAQAYAGFAGEIETRTLDDWVMLTAVKREHAE
jgi:ribosomal protein L11 methyltransferase